MAPSHQKFVSLPRKYKTILYLFYRIYQKVVLYVSIMFIFESLVGTDRQTHDTLDYIIRYVLFM